MTGTAKSESRISIHALHYRVRQHNEVPFSLAHDFNPRTPLQSATISTITGVFYINKFQSTHSITECDAVHDLHWRNERPISIHALHYRVRPGQTASSMYASHEFQSTHSITECDTHKVGNRQMIDISIHALHYRVRHGVDINQPHETPISIHALHYRVRQDGYFLTDYL